MASPRSDPDKPQPPQVMLSAREVSEHVGKTGGRRLSLSETRDAMSLVKRFDRDHDGRLGEADVAEMLHVLVHERTESRFIKKMMAMLILMTIILIGATAGLSWGMAVLANDVEVQGGVLVDKTTSEPVRVAESLVPGSLSSDLPMSSLEELKRVRVTSATGAEVSLLVLAVTKLEGEVTLITPVGSITLSQGTRLTFKSASMMTVFEEGGFVVDPAQRHLLGDYELQGAYNTLPVGAAAAQGQGQGGGQGQGSGQGQAPERPANGHQHKSKGDPDEEKPRGSHTDDPAEEINDGVTGAASSEADRTLLASGAASAPVVGATVPTVEWFQSFETGAFVTSPARSSETITITSCSTATKAVTKTSPRSGLYSAQITVKSPACTANWRAALYTRDWKLNSTRTYSLCMWIRSNTSMPLMPKIAFSFYRRSGTSSILIQATQPRITNTWAQYCHPYFKVPVDNALYYWTFNPGAAAAWTTYFIDDISLTSEPSSEYSNWLTTAPARIEALRKGDFSLDVRYSDNSPVPTSAVSGVSVYMRKHAFPFGMAYSPENYASTSTQLPWYKAKAGSLFSALVPENYWKWPYFEPTRNKTAMTSLLNNFVNFATANNFSHVRMHTAEWYLPDVEFTGHWSRKSGCANYTLFLKERIQRDVKAWAGKVNSMDVMNELLDRRAYADTCNLFAGGVNSTIVQAFKWANQADPNLKLCVNEYDMQTSERWTNMVELVDWLRSNGAPVHCVGVQSHISLPDIEPDLIAYRLGKMSSLLGIPAEITETSFFTYEDTTTWDLYMQNETAQAIGFDRMLRTYFSHPSVSSVLLWGFTDSNHYIPSGGIYRSDGTPKPAGVVVEDLITRTWNSSSPAVAITPDASGSLHRFRGFYGRYEARVTVAGTTHSVWVNFPTSGGSAQSQPIVLPIPPPSGRKLLRG